MQNISQWTIVVNGLFKPQSCCPTACSERRYAGEVKRVLLLCAKMEKTRNDCYVGYPFKREPGHEANLHGERAEARSAKMRGARPRRAHDGVGGPRGEVAMDAPASLTIDPINILRVGD